MSKLLETEFEEEQEVLKSGPEHMTEVEKPQKKAEDAIEIDIVDDVPEADKGRRVAKDVEEDDEEEHEIEKYSKGVQKRFAKQTEKFHAERRRADAAVRERDELLALSKRALAENNQLKELIESGEKVMMGSEKGRLEATLAAARTAYAEAHEAGDPKGMVAAQEQIARSIAQIEKLNGHRPMVMARENVEELDKKYVQTQVPQPSENASNWLEKNPWFGKPESASMTRHAMAMSRMAIESGIVADTKEYFDFVDAEMKHRFPDKFGTRSAQPRRTSTPVAPAQRTAQGTTPRKVVLTESQVRIAKKLGLTLQQYAEQVALEEGNGDERNFTHASRA